MNEPLCYNKNIAPNNKHTYIKEWDNKNIKQVKDVVNNQGEFLKHHELIKIYNITTNYLITFQITHSIPQDWLRIIKIS